MVIIMTSTLIFLKKNPNIHPLNLAPTQMLGVAIRFGH
jgi:hypothetical protein